MLCMLVCACAHCIGCTGIQEGCMLQAAEVSVDLSACLSVHMFVYKWRLCIYTSVSYRAINGARGVINNTIM